MLCAVALCTPTYEHNERAHALERKLPSVAPGQDIHHACSDLVVRVRSLFYVSLSTEAGSCDFRSAAAASSMQQRHGKCVQSTIPPTTSRGLWRRILQHIQQAEEASKL